MRLLFVICLLLLIIQLCVAHERFKVRKGGRLERLHKRTLYEWGKASHHRPRTHRHKRRRHGRDGSMHIEHVLAHMDSFVRPRFGRSISSYP